MNTNNNTLIDNCVNFESHRLKKLEEKFLVRGRKPLYISYRKGQVSGDRIFGDLSNFGNRISSIKENMEDIKAVIHHARNSLN